MTSINRQMGLKPGGARRRMRSLSGVPCPTCRCVDVGSNVVHGTLRWTCHGCAHHWHPTAEEIAAYNARVRGRDRIEV